jgi:hypothetical protein
LYGDFRAVMEDDPWQVIPTAWIEAAQQRWTLTAPAGTSLDAIGVWSWLQPWASSSYSRRSG